MGSQALAGSNLHLNILYLSPVLGRLGSNATFSTKQLIFIRISNEEFQALSRSY